MISLRANKKIDVPVPGLDGTLGTVFFGSDDETVLPIEVLVASSPKPPTVPEMRSLFKWRKNDRSNLVVIAIETKGRVHLFGPAEDRQPISVEAAMAQRVLQAALEDPTPLMARRSLVSFYDNFGSTEMAGIKNKGLFATHHLRDNLPQRKDWIELQSQGQDLAKKRHRELITALGFEISTEERNTLILKAGPEKRVVAVLLEDNETFESPSGRFPSSPVAWGLTVAADNNVPWLIVLKKDQIRLHPGRDGVGVGQKGQAETFLELNLAQIDEEHLALLPLIFSASSLEKNGDVQKILDESSKYAVILGARLRERVYESVVPNISIAVAKKLQSQGLAMDSEGLQKAYSITLKILFRLLFQAYAEDRGLLPAGRNEGYDANSLKTIAKRDIEASPEDFGNVVNIWHDLVQVWDSIDEGNPRWQVPAYNGGLFGRDPELHPEGALIKSLELTDVVLGPALQALLIDMTEDGVRGPVDFRSLSVREFGTIYEGLLESSLSLAEVDLTVDSKDAWVPAKDGDTIMAKAGEPYFHSASGERKATGSYFTPKFVVDHLVERAIDPTIDKHLEKISGYLKSGDQATASREFFDFRVADLAMGSAHFLVAAVDRIEAKMRSYLSIEENNVPGVVDELQRLRKAATDALRGDEIAINEIEDPSLLRRQIAKRCVYGIDINPMAVELARLAIWIHTFVPGLPMSSLNHNLVCANSLTGIGSIDEALDALIPNRKGQSTFFDDAIYSGLETAGSLLIEAANASEADKAEILAAAELAERAKVAANDSRFIFDVALSARMGLVTTSSYFTSSELVATGKTPEVQSLVDSLKPAHMPYLFPEVFLRQNPGFDALIGNPPWEKIKLEAFRFWGMHIPGLLGKTTQEREAQIERVASSRPDLVRLLEADLKAVTFLRSVILSGPFEGLGSGDVDLYQPFAWRNWQLLRSGGKSGLVLPRTAFQGSGLKIWRERVLDNGSFESISICVNNRQWLFEAVHAMYSIVLATFGKETTNQIELSGPHYSRAELESEKPISIDAAEFRRWTTNFSIPSIPDQRSLEIFRKIKQQPRFDDSRNLLEPRAYRELDAKNDRDKFELYKGVESGTLSVYGGGSFNLWNSNFGDPYGTVTAPIEFRRVMLEKISSAIRSSKSPYFQLQEYVDVLPFEKARLAFRGITNAANTRTCIVSLIPPNTPLVHSAPTIVLRRSGAAGEAFLLAVMSSIPYDWQLRRTVEMNLTFEMLNDTTIPVFDSNSKRVQRLIQLSVALAANDHRFSDWRLEALGETLQGLNSPNKDESICEIDALVSLMYGLDVDEIVHIFKTFHRGWDYQSRLDKVLEFYEDWKNK